MPVRVRRGLIFPRQRGVTFAWLRMGAKCGRKLPASGEWKTGDEVRAVHEAPPVLPALPARVENPVHGATLRNLIHSRLSMPISRRSIRS